MKEIMEHVKFGIIEPSIFIIAVDVDDTQRAQSISDYIQQDLQGVQRGESTFEVNFNDNDYSWEQIFRALKERMDLNEDVVYLWDMSRPRGKTHRALFRTQIG